MVGAKSEATAPARSLEQRLRALRRANEVRIGRAQLKKELAAGTVRIEEILAQPPEVAKTAKVSELLLALPRVGRSRVARALAHCRISESKTASRLSERQRAELISLFRR